MASFMVKKSFSGGGINFEPGNVIEDSWMPEGRAIKLVEMRLIEPSDLPANTFPDPSQVPGAMIDAARAAQEAGLYNTDDDSSNDVEDSSDEDGEEDSSNGDGGEVDSSDEAEDAGESESTEPQEPEAKTKSSKKGR